MAKVKYLTAYQRLHLASACIGYLNGGPADPVSGFCKWLAYAYQNTGKGVGPLKANAYEIIERIRTHPYLAEKYGTGTYVSYYGGMGGPGDTQARTYFVADVLRMIEEGEL